MSIIFSQILLFTFPYCTGNLLLFFVFVIPLRLMLLLRIDYRPKQLM
jgi:hypothetical protein